MDIHLPSARGGKSHVHCCIPQVRRIFTAACMRAGMNAKQHDYGHIKSLHGKVALAFPFRVNPKFTCFAGTKGQILTANTDVSICR